MRMLAFRRPELLLFAALMVFALVVGLRSFRSAPAPVTTEQRAAPAPQTLSSEQVINTLKAQVRDNPDNAAAYAQLGLALLQRVRESADVGLYAQAGQALDAAVKHDPKNVDALVGQGTLALARHKFADALAWGEKARAINPYHAAIYGVIGDAYTELGRYDEAATAIDKMVQTRPDLSSYSRVAYQRELRGDVAGAAQALKLAISAGGPATENTAWTKVQLGNLAFGAGSLAEAEQIYADALASSPENAYAAAGLARVRAAHGDLAAATTAYEQIVQRLPMPEFVITLGDLYTLTGHADQARKQYNLVRAIEQLNTNAGVDVDLELALFDADHGGDQAKTVARARESYARRPSVNGADALAWALYRAGSFEEAARYSKIALRLGTHDAAMHYRAGMIAHALGDDTTARTYLRSALDTNPNFSLLYAGEARAQLARLKG